MNENQNKPLSRNIGPARISFNIEKGAFGAAYVKGWLSSSGRAESFKAFEILVKACGGRSSGGWVDDRGDHCPFEVRFEAGVLCHKHLVVNCECCDDANPFKLAAKAMSQKSLNLAIA